MRMRVEASRLSTTDHPVPKRFQVAEGEPFTSEDSSETIAEFTLRAGGRKINVAMLDQGDVTSRMEACSPGQLSPDQWTQL